MGKSVKIKLTILAIIIIILLFQFWQSDNEVEKIKQSHSVFCGTILSIGVGKGGYIIKYEFTVNGKRVKDNWGCTKNTDNRFKNGFNRILIVT